MNNGFPKKERERRKGKPQISLHHVPDKFVTLGIIQQKNVTALPGSRSIKVISNLCTYP